MAKRRANVEGSIRHRPDGRWEGRYTAGRDPETGKQIIKNVLAKTQRECKEKLDKAIEESKGLDVVKAGQYTVGQFKMLYGHRFCYFAFGGLVRITECGQ